MIVRMLPDGQAVATRGSSSPFSAVTVDDAAMRHAITLLRDAADSINPKTTLLNNRSSYGRPRVAGAVDAFAERWEQVLTGVHPALDGVADGVKACLQAYDDVDQQVCVDLRSLGSGL